MPTNSQNVQLFGPLPALGNVSNSGLILDGATEMLAFKYYPLSTSPIVAVDINATLVGTSPTFVVGVYADAADVPNTAGPVQLGTDTPGFTWAATGPSGLKTFDADTGALTVNVPVWIVVKYSSGTIDGSNSIQIRNFSSAVFSLATKAGDLRQRHYNGASWTATSAVVFLGMIVIKHADNTFAGVAQTGARAASTANDIFVNAGTSQVQGVRFKCGAQVKVVGVAVSLTKTGTPNDLVITVYEGDVSKYSNIVGNAYVISSTLSIVTFGFSSPVLLAADTYLYIIFSQTGTSGANDYDLNVIPIDGTYIDAIAPADFRFVHGNGAVPSALTVSTAEFPLCWPLIGDPATDLDMTGGGGGGAWVVGSGVVH